VIAGLLVPLLDERRVVRATGGGDGGHSDLMGVERLTEGRVQEVPVDLGGRADVAVPVQRARILYII
jgi:hypothetical protein